MLQIDSNEIGQQFPCSRLSFFYEPGQHLLFFHSMGNFPLLMHDMNISFKGLELIHGKFLTYKYWSYHDHKLYLDQDFLWFLQGDRRKTVICPFKRISWRFASIVDYNTLFSKEIVKDLSFLSEICNVIIIMINWWNKRYYLKTLSVLTSMTSGF